MTWTNKLDLPEWFWDHGWIDDPDTWYALELRRLCERAPA